MRSLTKVKHLSHTIISIFFTTIILQELPGCLRCVNVISFDES